MATSWIGLSWRFQRLQDSNPKAIEWIRPKLLPDEFISGWLNRFAFANCHEYAREFVQAVTTYTKATLSDNNDTYHISSLVSDYTGITPADLDNFHTLRPWFSYCGTKLSVTGSHPSAQNRAYVKTQGTCSAFCPDCIKEDLSFWGWNYWRRSHQIPGVTTCLKHGNQLLFTQKNCFISHSPLAALPIGKPCTDSSNFGRTYSEIANGMLDVATPCIQLQTREKLKALLQVRAGDKKLNSSRAFLTSAAGEQIPETWVRHAYSGKVTKQALIKELCQRFPKQLSPIQVAISLALLFDDPDQALLFWANQRHQLAQISPLAKSGSSQQVH